MPMYEYYCPTCQATLQKLRSISASDAEVQCAAGHSGLRRLVSTFALGGRSNVAEMDAPAGGGCACGGACACGGH